MTITELVRTARHGARAGSGGAWRIHRWRPAPIHDPSRECVTLYHHNTAMLTWRADDPRDPTVLAYSTGWGSRSDQGGMNRAFKVLGLPLYFSRAGGANIEDTSDEAARAAERIDNPPLRALREHVTGKVERGEAESIVGIEAA